MNYPYELPKLNYEYGSLEPHIDASTMEIHHSKHHQGYVDKLNKALEGHEDLQQKNLTELLGDLDSTPEEIRTAVRNNGGGHANHSLFWSVMSSSGGGDPTSDVAEAIANTFGSFDDFKSKFTEVAVGVFGSGWAWLSKDEGGNLHLHGLPNQDSPLMHGHTPVLGLDVWEHAYYLNYQNRRPDYIEAWWNVVDWSAVEKNFRN